MSMTRREAAAALAAFVLPLEAQGPAEPPKLGFFTPAGAKLVEIFANVIIPPDEYPGAGDTGAAYYIDKQMQGPYKDKLDMWRAGLFTFRLPSGCCRPTAPVSRWAPMTGRASL